MGFRFPIRQIFRPSALFTSAMSAAKYSTSIPISARRGSTWEMFLSQMWKIFTAVGNSAHTREREGKTDSSYGLGTGTGARVGADDARLPETHRVPRERALGGPVVTDDDHRTEPVHEVPAGVRGFRRTRGLEHRGKTAAGRACKGFGERPGELVVVLRPGRAVLRGGGEAARASADERRGAAAFHRERHDRRG
jgi:hypothetical protein